MTLDEFDKAGLCFKHKCEVFDDENKPQVIKFWFEAQTDGVSEELVKVQVFTDWAVEFSFNVMPEDTYDTLVHMAESCIKDAYYDEDF